MPTVKILDELVINKVENQTVFDYMANNGLLNEDELYLVEDESDSDYLPLTGGTLTGPLVLAGAPTANLQAATKKYVDDMFPVTETDPVFAASAAHGISSSDISAWNAKGTYSKPSGGIPKTDLASAVQTSLGKADTALQSFTETDPTVPSWAKASSKPSYTASEVGALPASTAIPSKTSDLTNDSGFLTAHQDISGKADKVSSATNNNFAALDANGNLKDSGHKHSDYLTAHQDISGKQDKITASGLLKGNGSGGVSAAVAGTDYQTPLVAGTDYATPAALNNYIPTSEKGANSGVATLNSNGKVTADQTTARLFDLTSSGTLVNGGNGVAYLCYETDLTLGIPADVSDWDSGFEVEIIRWGSNTVTITANSAATLNGVAGGSKTIQHRYGSAVLKLINRTRNYWLIQGDI